MGPTVRIIASKSIEFFKMHFLKNNTNRVLGALGYKYE